MTQVPIEEAVQLGAVDGSFYARFFFPRTVRQAPSAFDAQIWEALDNPAWRYIALEIFRGGAKTARLRLYASRRIAYGISHSIVYTSNSEGHAVRSVSWLKRQVTYNELWARTFNLRRGGKWADGEIEIIHGIDEYPIKVVAVGITGQVRGFLSDDDFRPDLIVGDDVDNEETTNTDEQRKKAQNLFFGALGKSLAPPTEAPGAKMALLQTPLAPGDTIDVCSKDPAWHTLTFGCFDNDGNSTWEARFPTEFLKQEKLNHIRRNQLSMWMREMECKIVSTEQASFKPEWLRVYEVLPEGIRYTMAVDPAFSDPEKAQANDNDYMAVVKHARIGQKVFLVEYALFRGKELTEAIAKIFELVFRGRPSYLAVETIAAQKILVQPLRLAMQRHGIYIPIKEIKDKRRKSDRITQELGDVAANGNYYWLGPKAQPEFNTQYTLYHPGYKDHDDLLDAIAMDLMADKTYALTEEGDTVLDGEYTRIMEEERSIADLSYGFGAP